MIKNHFQLGRIGEDQAVIFLKRSGYSIVHTNYKTRIGEIDVIAKDGKVICFIEVKTRSSTRFGIPEEAVSLQKQRQISKSALLFLKQNKLLDNPARFDVVSVRFPPDNTEPKINLIKNAFSLEESFIY